jgi:DNA-binding transcriptional MerR regulator
MRAAEAQKLYKISDLSRETGVSIPTIKFYIREGLLPAPTVKTGRNMAYYDHTFIDRLRVIKELQQKRFLPLDVIRAILDHDSSLISQSEVETLLGIEGRFYEQIHHAPDRDPLTRKQILGRYCVDAKELQYAVELGVLTPVLRNGVEVFEGDDLLILEVLQSLEEHGFDDEFIPTDVALPLYVNAIDKLVADELKMFTKAATGRIDEAKIAEMALAGVKLLEQFLALLRRKRMLNAIQDLRHENKKESAGGAS